MATVVDIIAAIKLLTTCKETSKSRGLRERLQSSIDKVTELIQTYEAKLCFQLVTRALLRWYKRIRHVVLYIDVFVFARSIKGLSGSTFGN